MSVIGLGMLKVKKGAYSSMGTHLKAAGRHLPYESKSSIDYVMLRLSNTMQNKLKSSKTRLFRTM